MVIAIVIVAFHPAKVKVWMTNQHSLFSQITPKNPALQTQMKRSTFTSTQVAPFSQGELSQASHESKQQKQTCCNSLWELDSLLWFRCRSVWFHGSECFFNSHPVLQPALDTRLQIYSFWWKNMTKPNFWNAWQKNVYSAPYVKNTSGKRLLYQCHCLRLQLPGP